MPKQAVFISFVLGTALFTATSVNARSIFVENSDRASDTNTGTAAKPLRTLGFAIQIAEPGDNVLVTAGDYRDEDTGYGVGVIPVLNSGTDRRPIKIRGRTGKKPLIRRFLLQGCENVVISGFELQGLDFEQVDGWSPMPTIVQSVDPTLPRPDFTLDYSTRRDQIEQEFGTYLQLVDDLGYEIGFDIENSNNIEISRNKISGYFAGIQCRGAQQIEIDNNEISECYNGIFTIAGDDPTVPSLTDATITRNTIEQCLDIGIDIRAQAAKVDIKRNKIRYSGRTHISLQDGASECEVFANIVEDGGYYSETMEYPGSSGISLNNAGDGNVVELNRVSGQIDHTGIDGNGIILDFLQDGATATLVKNRSLENMGAGLNLTASPGALITRNTFSFNGLGAQERRRGAGIKISRDSDIGNVITWNTMSFNRVAGILSSDTIQSQQEVDRNRYYTWGAPLIWDGYSDGDKEYYTIDEVFLNTAWEDKGRAVYR